MRVLTRDATRAASLREAGAEIVVGDLLDRGSLERACHGATAVLATAHSMFGRGRAASAHVDGAAHRALIDIARSSGVRRFVYTSVYDFDGAFGDVPFFRIKGEVEDYLRASGLAYTILRPTPPCRPAPPGDVAAEGARRSAYGFSVRVAGSRGG